MGRTAGTGVPGSVGVCRCPHETAPPRAKGSSGPENETVSAQVLGGRPSLPTAPQAGPQPGGGLGLPGAGGWPHTAPQSSGPAPGTHSPRREAPRHPGRGHHCRRHVPRLSVSSLTRQTLWRASPWGQADEGERCPAPRPRWVGTDQTGHSGAAVRGPRETHPPHPCGPPSYRRPASQVTGPVALHLQAAWGGLGYGTAPRAEAQPQVGPWTPAWSSGAGPLGRLP